MRIRTLAVRSVLHYDALDLDFGGGRGGLHILHGPNEAGKSTLLKLVLDLLFGGTLSDDRRDFYDSRSQLEGTIESEAHPTARIVRKKNRNRLLLDAASEMSEAELMTVLGGYDRDRFSLLFGFDHQKLQTGGESLLGSDGEAGVSLFEAGGGIGHLQNLLMKLGDDAAELLDASFRGNSAKRLNRAWRAYQEAQRAVRTSGLRSDAWHRQRDEIASLHAQTQQLQAQLQERQRERSRLERVNRVGKFVAGVETARAQLTALGNVTRLTVETEADIEIQLSNRERLATERVTLDAQRGRLVLQRDEIVPDELAISHAQTVVALNDGLQAYVTRQTEDLPGLMARCAQRESDAVHQLQRLAPHQTVESAKELAIALTEQTRMDQLMKALADARTEVHAQQRQVAEKAQELAAFDDDLQQLGDVPAWEHLARVLQDIQSHGQTATAQAQITHDITRRQQQLELLYAAQTLWGGPVDTVDTLPVPLAETVSMYAAAWAEAVQGIRECEQARDRAKDDGEDARRELETLELGGRVPVEADLATVRARRDAGWALVKHSWLQGGVPLEKVIEYSGDEALDRAFEAALLESDQTADWMRKEADGSARRALLLLRERQAARTAQSQQERCTELTAAFEKLTTRWQTVWAPCGMEPGTPAEMKDFLANVHRPLCEGVRVLRELRERQVVLRGERDRDRAALCRVAAQAGVGVSDEATLETLVERCAQYVQTADDLQRRRQSLFVRRNDCDRQLAVQRTRLSEAQSRQSELLTQWQELCARYPHLPDWDLASVYLQSLNKLFDDLHAVDQTRREMTTKQSASAAFEAQAAALATAFEDPLEALADVASWVRHMRERLHRAQQAANDLERIDAELVHLDVKRTKHTDDAQACGARLRVWMRMYDCADIAQLGAVVESSSAYRKAAAVYEERTAALRNAGDGLSAEQLEQAYRDTPDIDALPGQIETLARDIEDGQLALDEHKGQLRERQIAFEQLDGSQTAAADHAQDAQRHLAQVDRSWRMYLRTALAEHLLRRAIEAFRERNESTVMSQASDIFRRLTLGSYGGLGVEQDKASAYLEAIRADGSKRRVSQLSDGTRDQLYLALRLAFVSNHGGGGQSLPLVMDDILVHFDDARTEATLRVLHELSANTQVLYFTHHQSVVDAALGLAHGDGVRLHSLGGGLVGTGERESAASLAEPSRHLRLF